MAWDKKLALGEFHSHPGGLWRAQFSASDIYGLDEFVPHVRWRLRGQPYFAIVVAPSDFDALIWRTPQAEALKEFQVGDRVLTPTGLTISSPRPEREGRR